MSNQRGTERDDENIDLSTLPPKSFKIGPALPVLLMLAVWVLGAWFTWSFAVGQGVTARMVIRTGTMNVTSCARVPEYAWWLYQCSGDATFAPEDAWNGNHKQLREHAVVILSPTALSGPVEFVTYDTRKSSRSNYDGEVGLPTATQITGSTFAGFLPTLGVFLGFAAGGIVVAMVTHRVRSVFA